MPAYATRTLAALTAMALAPAIVDAEVRAHPTDNETLFIDLDEAPIRFAHDTEHNSQGSMYRLCSQSGTGAVTILVEAGRPYETSIEIGSGQCMFVSGKLLAASSKDGATLMATFLGK